MTRWAASLVAAAMLAGFGCTSATPVYTVQTVAAPDVHGGAWFEQSGCTACHSVSAYNIVNVARRLPTCHWPSKTCPGDSG